MHYGFRCPFGSGTCSSEARQGRSNLFIFNELNNQSTIHSANMYWVSTIYKLSAECWGYKWKRKTAKISAIVEFKVWWWCLTSDKRKRKNIYEVGQGWVKRPLGSTQIQAGFVPSQHSWLWAHPGGAQTGTFPGNSCPILESEGSFSAYRPLQPFSLQEIILFVDNPKFWSSWLSTVIFLFLE